MYQLKKPREESARKVQTSFPMLKRRNASDGRSVSSTCEIESVEFFSDDTLSIDDFNITALVAGGNTDALRPVRFADDDKFRTVANVAAFDATAQAAATYVKLLQKNQS